MEFQIRREESKDINQVREILKSVLPTDAESRLVKALQTYGKAIISLVAVNVEQALGHVLFSPATTTPPIEAKGIGLAPVAVRPDVQSQGIGSQLIRDGLRRCQELGYDYCMVLGSPIYYHRFGFEKASNFGLQNEYGVDEEFMVIRFTESKLSEERLVDKLVRYKPEFALFSI